MIDHVVEGNRIKNRMHADMTSDMHASYVYV
jgi:hypothetical protein